MIFNGLQADKQFVGDLLVAEAMANFPDNLFFPWRNSIFITKKFKRISIFLIWHKTGEVCPESHVNRNKTPISKKAENKQKRNKNACIVEQKKGVIEYHQGHKHKRHILKVSDFNQP